jgi:hypothetical protein
MPDMLEVFPKKGRICIAGCRPLPYGYLNSPPRFARWGVRSACIDRYQRMSLPVLWCRPEALMLDMGADSFVAAKPLHRLFRP